MSAANTPLRDKKLTTASLVIGGRYNWKHQPERLIYRGTRHYPGDRRTWHQFAKVDAPGVCWSEVLDADLSSFEESTDA